jgi:hypothetical protein
MDQTTREHFALPNADQMRDHLAAHPAQAPSPWFGRLPLIALGMIAALLLLADTWVSLTLPWVILLVVFGVMTWRARQVQQLERSVNECQQWAMRRHYRAALARAWPLLRQLRRQPLLRHRLIAVMAHCLDDLACFEPAMEVYDHLLAEVDPDHAGAVQLHTHRAIAALHCDRLADADDALKRVRQHIDVKEHEPIAAAYHLARVLQEVRTHHDQAATQRGDDMVATLRPLGVEAGFGHALLAWCHRRRLRQGAASESRDDLSAPMDHAQAMRRWWRRATLLLSPAAIVYRFPELAPLAEEDPR